MKMTIKVKRGADVAKVLRSVAPREAKNLARSTNHAVAGEVRDRVKFEAPDDPYTSSGDIVRTTKIKRLRARGLFFRSGVTIGAFYWRFHEAGTSKLPPNPFVLRAVEAIRPHVPKLWREHFVIKLSARLKRVMERNKASNG